MFIVAPVLHFECLNIKTAQPFSTFESDPHFWLCTSKHKSKSQCSILRNHCSQIRDYIKLGVCLIWLYISRAEKKSEEWIIVHITTLQLLAIL